MSFWAKVGVKITDLSIFKQACQKNDVSYELNTDAGRQWNGHPIHATIKDNRGGSQGFLIREGGAYRLTLDTDRHYSSLTQRLGANGGTLMRDYSVGVVRSGILASGGMITETVEQSDGSIVLKAASM